MTLPARHRLRRTAAALVLATAAAGVGAVAPATAATSSSLPPSNVFAKDVRSAPLDSRSTVMVDSLEHQVTSRYGGVAAFNVFSFGVGISEATSGQRRVDVGFNDCQGKGWTPRGLYGPGGHFEDVPIPADAVPAAGTDGHLTVYSPSSDQLWEFWKARKTSTGWSACWGGRIDRISSSTGAFPATYGASASGLASSLGAVRIDEARSGEIRHALSLVIPNIAHHSRISYPATRSDGYSWSSTAIPMGTRFRLDPRVDVDALRLHPVAEAVARAAQQYGFVVTDTSGAVAVTAESGDRLKATTGSNPWYGILGSTKHYSVMEGFPWDRLQMVQKDWGKPTS